MKKSILQSAAIAALSIATVLAQPRAMNHGGPGGPGTGSGAGTTTPTPPDPATQAARQVSFLTHLLTLTTGQQTQATSYFTASITANQALQAQIATAQTALLTAIKANNTSNITAQATALGNIQASMIANDAKADAAFYLLLTADQKTKLDSLNNDGFFGPGGFDIHVPGAR